MKNSQKRNQKTSKYIKIAVLCLSFIVIICMMFLIYNDMKDKKHHTADDSADNKEYSSIEVDGKDYNYNTGLINILFIGFDSSADIESLEAKNSNTGENGRADSIYVLSLDRRNKKMQILALSRDTMTDIEVTDASGQVVGWGKDHLAFAYSYGDGKDKSCRLMSDAVSNLVNNIPIVYYCAANINSLGTLINIVGSVEVQVPNDDLKQFGPEYEKGQTLIVDKSNIERFVRFRDIGTDFSNEGRMERQKVFLEAYMNKFKQLAKDEATIVKTTKILSTLVTNISIGELNDFISLYAESSFDMNSDYYKPSGENKTGQAHDEFYIDEKAFQELILKMFYTDSSLS